MLAIAKNLECYPLTSYTVLLTSAQDLHNNINISNNGTCIRGQSIVKVLNSKTLTVYIWPPMEI